MDKAEHERIFGKRDMEPGRRSYIVAFEGQTYDLMDPASDNIRGAYLGKKRTKSTRTAIMSDISEPFVTGLINGDVITSRHEKREFMARNDLVEHEPTMPNKPVKSWVEEIDHEAEIATMMQELSMTDPSAEVFQEPLEVNGGDEFANIDEAAQAMPVME